MTDAAEDDLSPLEQRRARLRAWHDQIVEAAEALPMPETHAEAAQAFRCVASADRTLMQLYSRTTEAVLNAMPRLSPAVRRPRAASSPIARVRKMRERLDGEPEDFEYIYDDDVVETDIAASPSTVGPALTDLIGRQLDQIHRHQAKAHGFWADGTPWNPAEPDHGCMHLHYPNTRERFVGKDPQCKACFAPPEDALIDDPP